MIRPGIAVRRVGAAPNLMQPKPGGVAIQAAYIAVRLTGGNPRLGSTAVQFYTQPASKKDIQGVELALPPVC